MCEKFWWIWLLMYFIYGRKIIIWELVKNRINIYSFCMEIKLTSDRFSTKLDFLQPTSYILFKGVIKLNWMIAPVLIDFWYTSFLNMLIWNKVTITELNYFILFPETNFLSFLLVNVIFLKKKSEKFSEM